MYRRSVLLVLFCMFLSFTPIADVTVTTVESDGIKVVEYYSADRYARYENGEMTDCMDLAKGIITMLDSEKKIYAAEKTGDFVKETLKQQEEMKKQLASMGINMPVPKKNKNTKISFEKKASKKINGYDCDQYILKMNNADFMEIWISPAIQKLIDKEFDPKKAEKIHNEMKILSKDMDPTDGIMEKLEKTGYIVYEDNLASLGGMGMMFGDNPMFQVQNNQISGKKASDGSKINVSISNTKIKPEIFSIPAGFTKKTLADFNAAQMEAEEVTDNEEDSEYFDMDMDFGF